MPSRAISMQVTSRNDRAGGAVRIVGAGRRAGGLFAVGEPVPLVRAAVGVEDDDAMVAAVGDEDLVGGGVVRDGRRTVQRGLAVGAVHLAGRADGEQIPAGARKLQDVRVGRPGRRRRRRPRRHGAARRPLRLRALLRAAGRVRRAASRRAAAARRLARRQAPRPRRLPSPRRRGHGRPRGGGGSSPAAAIQTLPFVSTAMPPGTCGH